MSGADSTSDERQSNRTRVPVRRKTPRANFPGVPDREPDEGDPRLRQAVLQTADLDTNDPGAGGGRGFFYEWELKSAALQDQIDSGGGGGSGGSGASFTFTQSTPLATWTINHNLGFIPDVILVDGSGQELYAEIRHPSTNQCVVYHSAPYVGTAYLRS